MQIETLLNGIEQYGYFALFFFLWLGIVGMPIPDEVIVMSGGFVTTLGILKPIPAFFITYAGVVSGLTIGYCLGRAVGPPALNYFKRKKKMGKYINKAYDLIDRYGAQALVLSYFFPVVRHIVPYIVGINRLPYSKYVLYSYSTGLVWTLILFVTGRYFGQSIEMISEFVNRAGWILLITFLVGLLAFFLTKMKKPESK